ncbi:Glutamate-rich protein 5 [Microtus ochrogaster]|uniref:Glutamate-rich protein 5 n=1 Tax=Microtus ochrogaster TaxID=79684 RepID=A0A8J6GXH9_MICOH|nr:Glutamate-rich protein 5 [Microtus ochrogaster]
MDSPGAVEASEIPQAAGGTKLLETVAESALPLETATELPPEEAMGKNAQPQTVEAIPKENNSPEMSEGNQFVEKAEQKELQETSKDKQFQLLEAMPKENNSPEVAEGGQSAESSEKQQPQEAPCKDEQPQLLERILKESETPQVPDGSQLVQTPVVNESLCETPDGDGSQLVQTPVVNESLYETPDGTRDTQGSHPEANAGSREELAGAAETATNVDVAREIHTDKEEQHIEGETGEKMEAELKHEKGSEEAKVKEQEAGEAADLGSAGDSDGRATVHSLL